MKQGLFAFLRPALAFVAAALFALPAAAAVHEDDWLKVETPDKVSPGSGFQVKVTLKKDLGADENVSVAMHRMKPDGNWRDTGEWRPPQSMKKGETKVYAFTAAWAEDIGHFGPLVFTAPKGDWNKATHKLFCGKIEWAMSPEQAAAKKKAQEEAEARKRPPAGITYKKSWLQPRGFFKPGTDEPMKELREGDTFELVADYYLDASEYWNDKCHVVAFPCGPWIDNPDGVYEKGAHHVGYEGLGWSFKPVTPGKGTVRFRQTLKKAYRYNSLFYHVRFRGGDDKDFPWTKTCGAPAIARHLDGLGRSPCSTSSRPPARSRARRSRSASSRSTPTASSTRSASRRPRCPPRARRRRSTFRPSSETASAASSRRGAAATSRSTRSSP